jgi:glucokinase
MLKNPRLLGWVWIAGGFYVSRPADRSGHVSAERGLSGPGLENIYRAIGALDKVETALQNATQITRSALRGECNIAVEALNVFCAFLGSFAGNAALTFDARGGVYIAPPTCLEPISKLRRAVDPL